jgi:hypothetical protein
MGRKRKPGQSDLLDRPMYQTGGAKLDFASGFLVTHFDKNPPRQ